MDVHFTGEFNGKVNLPTTTLRCDQFSSEINSTENIGIYYINVTAEGAPLCQRTAQSFKYK